MSTSVLVVVPARGGSKGIPRKNLRALAGEPLISYGIATALASKHRPNVVVTSDDDEILTIAAKYGAAIHRRPSSLGGDAVTLDGVVHDVLMAQTRQFDIVATVQPTSPLLLTASLDEAIDRLVEDDELDTVISATDDRHLRWIEEADGSVAPAYAARVNRQQLPKVYRETGGFLVTRSRWVTPVSRIGARVALHELTGAEAIDIDTPDDFNLCEWHLSRRHVLFVVTGHSKVGLGHVFNTLTVANHLMRHEISFLVDRESGLAEQVIRRHNYPVHRQHGMDLIAEIRALKPDVVVNDRLDTSAEYMIRLRESVSTVINFEDLGPGAHLADLVINAIYPERQPLPNHYFGPRYFCLRHEFAITEPRTASSEVRTVLVTFGGTDPNDLTRCVLSAIGPECRRRGIELTAILGMGYPEGRLGDLQADRIQRSVSNMSDEIRRADIVFTSAGRTIFEVASVGTPAIVLAQNERELTHTFADRENGFLNLGLGTKVTSSVLLQRFLDLIDKPETRADMQRRMSETDLRNGVHRVVNLINRTIEERR